jgi:hypothetical protein
MLVSPVQQTPLAYDPARQILTPPAPVDLPPQQQPATPPIQQGDTPQDKFQPRDGGGRSQQDAGTSDSQKAATAGQLHNAWLRLQQLQEEANQALLAGDARGAKQAAQEAAQVAVTIQNVTGSSPDVALGPIEVAAQQISAHDASTQGDSGSGDGIPGSSQDSSPGTSTPGTQPPGSAPPGATLPGDTSQAQSGDSSGSPPGTVIELARASLGTARDIVDTAASIPSHPAADRASISGYKQTVLQAMAGVEAIAARLLGVATASSASQGRIDIRA